MAVWVRQSGTDLPASEYLIAPITAETDRKLLQRKATSASAKGWVVVWDGQNTLTATKQYPDGVIRQRIFEVR